MYDISVPVMVTAPTFNREAVLKDLKLVGAKRVLLAIPFLNHDASVMESYYDALRSAISFFRENGVETGVWFWTFRFETQEAHYTVMVNSQGEKCHTSTAKYCPLDEGYLTYMENHVKRLAELHPDLILFDDDFAFGFTSMHAPACYCDLHRAKMAEILGEEVPPADQLYKLMYSGKKNPLRSAFLKACGDSLVNLSKRMRAAVDTVDPTVRMGQCGCITTFDADGVDSFTISKILAGNTKPYLRLIGAPYWDEVRLHGNRLVDVIGLERMARAWYDADDMEIVSEGDTYPRPRHAVPASHLELFDAALRADGSFSGIMKYLMDYNSSASYERGYINAHLKNVPDYEKTAEVFGTLHDSGIRIYESMRKIEDADFSRDLLDNDLVRYQFFSRAVRFLAHNSIPAVHKGRGCAGISFGENVRALLQDPEAFKKPMILDTTAAIILQENGVDVGLVSVGERFIPGSEEYLKDHEFVGSVYGSTKTPYACEITVSEKAKIETLWHRGTETLIGSYTYENAAGQRFLVYGMDAFACAGEMYKNYARQKQIFDFLEETGAAAPVRCQGHPDLYVLCKEDDESLAVGFYNCFADEIDDLTATLPAGYKKAEIYRAEGDVVDNTLKIKHLPAYNWCFAKLWK